MRSTEALIKARRRGRNLGLAHYRLHNYDVSGACRNAAHYYSDAAACYLEGYMGIATEKGIKVTAHDFELTSRCLASCPK